MVCRSLAAAIAVAAAGCATTPNHTAIGPAPARGTARLYPLPEGCEQTSYDGAPPWHRLAGFPCTGVQRAPDGGWVMLVHGALEAYDRYGQLRWRSELAHGTGKRCGHADGFAVDAAGRTVVGCGYSLLSFAPDGAFRWQVWPGGDRDITAPVVDADGTIFVGVGGALYAVSPDDGATRWTVLTGWFGSIAATRGGDLLIEAALAVELGPYDAAGYHFFDDGLPPELIVIDRRRGTIITRAAHADHRSWPVWVDLIGERGGRLP